MKHLSDDRITKELENLSQKFKPSRAQKERAHRNIFQEKGYRKKVRIQTWIPTVVTFILLLSIISGAFFLINDNVLQGNKNNVTSDWDGVFFQQTSFNSPTHYSLYFYEGTLFIYDTFNGATLGTDFTEEDFKKHYTITDTKLIPGEYEKYSVLKSKDAYTIKVKGETEFTYTLNKVAPRKYIGEDGIKYSTSLYLD
ncbi:hypothetical protein [Sporosarcina sp. UB5]|uniref:hypothetical protein n=1 Tax=Sporosarcina sp. UB5 TaxID=3047463 RepID=UPI003D799566